MAEVGELEGGADRLGLLLEDEVDEVVGGEVDDLEDALIVGVLLVGDGLLVVLGGEVQVDPAQHLGPRDCEVGDGVAEFEAEDGPAPGAVGPQLLEDVVELVVDAVVEGEVARDEVLVPQHLPLELLDLLLVEVGRLQLPLLGLFGEAADHDLLLSAADVLEDVDGPALEGQPHLLQEALLVAALDVVQQPHHHRPHVLVGRLGGAPGLCEADVDVDGVALDQLGVGGDEVVQQGLAPEDGHAEVQHQRLLHLLHQPLLPAEAVADVQQQRLGAHLLVHPHLVVEVALAIVEDGLLPPVPLHLLPELLGVAAEGGAVVGGVEDIEVVEDVPVADLVLGLLPDDLCAEVVDVLLRQLQEGLELHLPLALLLLNQTVKVRQVDVRRTLEHHLAGLGLLLLAHEDHFLLAYGWLKGLGFGLVFEGDGR